jgi:hypothetical protein
MDQFEIDSLINLAIKKGQFYDRPHRHFSVIYTSRKKKTTTGINILSYGINTFLPNSLPIHAELDAIMGLKPFVKSRPMVVDLIVIKTSNTTTCSSKPCQMCINSMRRLPQKHGYRIKNVHYTDSDGHIHSVSLDKIESDHKSRFYRRFTSN